MKVLSTIPFAGFYESLHSQEIDYTIENMFTDKETGCNRNEGLEARVWNSWDYCAICIAYAKEYTEQLSHALEVPFTFESMQSPKEYNFTTDRIFVEIELDQVEKIFKELVSLPVLRQLIKENFTSRSGFISYYSNDLDDWGTVDNWDHNQIGTLLECYAYEKLSNNNEWNQYDEYGLMGSARGNAEIEGYISANTPNIERLYKIHDYLNKRMERKQ